MLFVVCKLGLHRALENFCTSRRVTNIFRVSSCFGSPHLLPKQHQCCHSPHKIPSKYTTSLQSVGEIFSIVVSVKIFPSMPYIAYSIVIKSLAVGFSNPRGQSQGTWQSIFIQQEFFILWGQRVASSNCTHCCQIRGPGEDSVGASLHKGFVFETNVTNM